MLFSEAPPGSPRASMVFSYSSYSLIFSKSPSKNLLILIMTLLKSKYSKTQKLHCYNASLAIAISLTLAILHHKSILCNNRTQFDLLAKK